MAYLIFKNARVFDGVDVVDNGSVAVEDGRIREMRSGALKSAKAESIDLQRRFLMPGLLDLHFHAYSVSFDALKLSRMPKPLLVSHANRLLEGALQRGYTTVRDPGGGEIGLKLAIEAGLVNGPRFFYGGKAISQTGGHGDMRHPEHEELCNCRQSDAISQVADGEDEMRKICRGELRKGADHIKLFISGGVTSPSDPIWMRQFTDAEVRAAVEEAATRRKYVAAHCLTDEGAQRCVALGIRSIEHGFNISLATAKKIAKSGWTYVVPTFAVLQQLREHKRELGLYEESIRKVDAALEQAYEGVRNCAKAGVKLGLGTDLFGPEYHYLQAREIEFRCAVQKPIDVLRSATSISAEIIQRGDELGVIKAGAHADLIVIDGDPLKDPAIFAKAGAMPMIMKGGSFVRNAL
ncbi:MAG TPA: amidohydrolase family protein [Burkholderiales bacterium]|nr:amidohydrolase family protein [Burkholderiales bacterium]